MAAIPGTASSPWMPPLPSVYRVVNELVATNSGEFVIYDPDGIEIGRVAVAATFSNQVKFVIADGSTDFAIGDAFSITVGIEETDYQIVAYNPAGADGSQRAAGILWEGVTTDGTNLGAGVVITRAAEVRVVDGGLRDQVLFPDGVG